MVGKLFHKILAVRLQGFLLENKIIDISRQKGFLSGLNGTLKHIFTITAILENTKQNNLPLSLTFFDLRNAFGSVSHKHIVDMLRHIQLPAPLITYISNVYSKLSASIKTKRWSTSWFPIERGIFQGDNLSPLLFLLVFNPVIHLCDQLPSTGFSLEIPIPGTTTYQGIHLPGVGCDRPQ